MFPIRNLKKQMETILQTYCFETAVTCAEVEEQGSYYIRRMAIHLGQYMAIYLAETITGLLQRVLTHPAKGFINESNAALLKLESASNLTTPDPGETAWDVKAKTKKSMQETDLRVHSNVL